MNRKFKKFILNIIFCNFINAFILIFDQFNAPLLNKKGCIKYYWPQKFEQ